MRRVLLIVAVAVASSAVTAAAIVLPASAAGDKPFFRAGDRVERFVSCMREHGFELGPETEVVITPDGVRVNGKEVDAEAFRNARRECGGPLRGLPRLERGELPELDGRLERLRDCLEAEEA